MQRQMLCANAFENNVNQTSSQIYLFLHKYVSLAMKSENVLAEMEHPNNIIGNIAFMLIGNRFRYPKVKLIRISDSYIILDIYA